MSSNSGTIAPSARLTREPAPCVIIATRGATGAPLYIESGCRPSSPRLRQRAASSEPPIHISECLLRSRRASVTFLLYREEEDEDKLLFYFIFSWAGVALQFRRRVADAELRARPSVMGLRTLSLNLGGALSTEARVRGCVSIVAPGIPHVFGRVSASTALFASAVAFRPRRDPDVGIEGCSAGRKRTLGCRGTARRFLRVFGEKPERCSSFVSYSVGNRTWCCMNVSRYMH